MKDIERIRQVRENIYQRIKFVSENWTDNDYLEKNRKMGTLKGLEFALELLDSVLKEMEGK